MHAFKKSLDKVKLLVIDYVDGHSFTAGDQPLNRNLFALEDWKNLKPTYDKHLYSISLLFLNSFQVFLLHFLRQNIFST